MMEYVITMETANGKVFLGDIGWSDDRRDALTFEHEQAMGIYFTLQDGRTGTSLDYEEA